MEYQEIFIGGALTFLGAVGGAILSHYLSRSESTIQWKRKNKEPIIQFRIQAHKDLLRFSQDMKLYKSTNIDGKPENCLLMFYTPFEYIKWNNEFQIFISQNYLWFSIDLLNYVLFTCNLLTDLTGYVIEQEEKYGSIPELSINLGVFLENDFFALGTKISDLLRVSYLHHL